LTSKITFVVGALGEGRENYAKLISKQRTGTRLRSIGSLSCLDNWGGISALTLEFCLEEIHQGLTHRVGNRQKLLNEVIFNGVGISMYINELIEMFPKSSIHLVRSDTCKFDTSVLWKEKILMTTDDITDEWVYNNNKSVKDFIQKFANDHSLKWTKIDNIPEDAEVAIYGE